MHGTYYEAACLDRLALGRDVKDFTEYVLQQTPRDLANHVHPDNCADVKFDCLVRDPIGTVRDVYEQLQWEFTPEYEKILTDFVAADKLKREDAKKTGGGGGGGKHGMYEHSPDRFGLNKYDFKMGVYEEYVEKYGLQDCKM
jgi:hypothetical protein